MVKMDGRSRLHHDRRSSPHRSVLLDLDTHVASRHGEGNDGADLALIRIEERSPQRPEPDAGPTQSETARPCPREAHCSLVQYRYRTSVMTSPGAIGPARKLAALLTLAGVSLEPASVVMVMVPFAIVLPNGKPSRVEMMTLETLTGYVVLAAPGVEPTITSTRLPA